MNIELYCENWIDFFVVDQPQRKQATYKLTDDHSFKSPPMGLGNENKVPCQRAQLP